ncbi:exonuclease 3'-5' domain-containing protein 2-like isoform X1 [Mytilus californianus]|uniref:exonuclease 3'-5' domain-containing protein 2-like isoform X1 n=1 Tax=Mytilus californianus TaxID=6549 RepID=UPI0022459577|nr:exonuclease 3'-5' domain-containing protein 2-like isoform X1 [Mytilus californianus]
MYKVGLVISRIVGSVLVGGLAAYLYLRFKDTEKYKPYKRKKEIFLIDTVEDYESFINTVRIEKVLGLDCEWVSFSGKRRPVALLQLATPLGQCALIRLDRMDSFPKSLQDILADKSILKVGVAVKEDGKKLHLDYGLVVEGCVDLRHVLNRVRGIYTCRSKGLQGQAESILGVMLDKSNHIRCGDWEADDLSQEQIEYAANDALVGVDIFMNLVLAKMWGKKPDINIEDIFTAVDETEFWTFTRSLIQGTVDVNVGGPWNSKNPAYKGPQLTNDEEISAKDKETRAYVLRQRPLYYNCYLLAPDGESLCTCDVKKAEWYIEKGLADKVNDDPFTVQLRFEPAGRPTSKDDYYLQEKENICVVCGSKDSYVRKQVVPKEYRRYFPPSLKDHASHDILLLCMSCHVRSTQYDTTLRYQLAEECNAPIDMGSGTKQLSDHDLQKVRSAARALLNPKAKIPESRKMELKKTLEDFYGILDFSPEILAQAAEIEYRVDNRDYIPHGKLVVRSIKKSEGLYQFQKRWRQHFVNTMKPQYLPTNWSIDHKHERLETFTDFVL